MKNTLITGGLGLIGTFVAKQILEKKISKKVICLDAFGRYSSSSNMNFEDFRKYRLEYLGKNVIIERGEAKYPSVVNKLITKYRPEYIFHLADLPLDKLQNLNSDEAAEGSITTTTNIINAIQNLKLITNYNPKKFIYASSSMVYGDFKSSTIDENHPTNPKEVYGTMKLAGEIVTKGLCKFYQIKYNIIRPSAVYGPTDMNRRVSQIFIEKALSGDTINIQGKDEKLDFTYVKDIAQGFVLSAVKKNVFNETFNITSGKARSLKEFAETIRKYVGNINYKITKRDKFRPKRGTLSINKAKRLLNYKPSYNLSKGIGECISFIETKKIK